MPAETTDHSSESSPADAPVIPKADAAVDRDGELPQTGPASTLPPPNQRFTRRKKFLIGVLGAVVIVAAVYGVPWIRQTLNTVSTDDAFINGHVTLVAPRVRGQVARVVVDDNNRVHKGDLLVELDKEPFQYAVAVKKAAFDSAQADMAATKATVRGVEALARSRRWQLQQAIENVDKRSEPIRQ